MNDEKKQSIHLSGKDCSSINIVNRQNGNELIASISFNDIILKKGYDIIFKD
ncbi:hypothetical protein LDJ81_03345 [Lentilactobacillus parabuchneri]|uniref:hypothetical protein n=1 Tax=Lentilactobacillus TaxID=2767893 RepID=UPI001C2BDF41|nr:MULTISPECIES: hypothetical protein [Lentilactobacillus]MBV0931362.1 hypothetical protein [Lentilactobacillus dabitei]MCW4398066.1 hypothetical protein [Lentilactobacillus parabuchneri]